MGLPWRWFFVAVGLVVILYFIYLKKSENDERQYRSKRQKAEQELSDLYRTTEQTRKEQISARVSAVLERSRAAVQEELDLLPTLKATAHIANGFVSVRYSTSTPFSAFLTVSGTKLHLSPDCRHIKNRKIIHRAVPIDVDATRFCSACKDESTLADIFDVIVKIKSELKIAKAAQVAANRIVREERERAKQDFPPIAKEKIEEDYWKSHTIKEPKARSPLLHRAAAVVAAGVFLLCAVSNYEKEAANPEPQKPSTSASSQSSSYRPTYSSSSSSRSSSSRSSSSGSSSSTPSDNALPYDSYYVYVSRTGECYHLDPDCSGMKSAEVISREIAIVDGYRPCSKCY